MSPAAPAKIARTVSLSRLYRVHISRRASSAISRQIRTSCESTGGESEITTCGAQRRIAGSAALALGEIPPYEMPCWRFKKRGNTALNRSFDATT
jgi:hypothetical protein